MRRLLVLMSAGLLALAVTAPIVTAATPVDGERGAGNPPCDFVKIDPVNSGTYALPDGSITIHVVSTDWGPAFWFTTEGVDIDALTVKGGPFYNLYTDPVGGEDNLYHSPLNLKYPNYQWYGLCHLCVDSKKIDEG
jgi:hypothetical protein